MARPSKWKRLSPAARTNLPTVLVAPFEALADAVDKSEIEKARSIFDAVLQNYCEWPAPAPQESTFTLAAPAALERHSDPYDLFLEDEEPLPDEVLSAAFQLETPTADPESDRQFLEQALAQNCDEAAIVETVSPAIAETTGSEPANEDEPPTPTASVPSDVTPTATEANELEAVEPPTVPTVVTERPALEPVAPAVNLDAIADLLQLAEACRRGTQEHTVAVIPEKALATELAADIEPQGVASGLENVTVTDSVALTATVATTTEGTEVTPIAEDKQVTERPEVESIAALETATEGAAVETVATAATAIETPASVAVETPDLELAARQIDPVTAVETVCQTEPVPVTSAVTPNSNDTTATAPLPMPLEDDEGFGQKLASPFVEAANLPSAPVALTTTSEHVEALADDDTSLEQKLSTPTEGFLTKTVLRQNVALVTTALETKAEGFCLESVAPELPSDHALVEPQNSRQKLISEPVSVTAIGLGVPVVLDQTTGVEAPLGSDKNSTSTPIEFLPESSSTDTMLTNGSINGSVEKGLKTTEEHEYSESVVFDKNTLDVFASNNTTLIEPLTAPSVLEAVVEPANLPVEAATVTPTVVLPEPPPPFDQVQELATFAAALFSTWQRLTLAKRGELSLCWGLNVSFDYLFCEGFAHMTAYRFFVLLEALLQSETDYEYGCLQVSCDRKTEPVELNGQPFNRLTFYAPGTPKHEQNSAALKRTQRVVATAPTAPSEDSSAHIREALQAHITSVEQAKRNQTPKPGGLFGALTQLGRLLKVTA